MHEPFGNPPPEGPGRPLEVPTAKSKTEGESPAVGSAHLPLRLSSADCAARRRSVRAIVPASFFWQLAACLRYLCLFLPICTCVDLSMTTWFLVLQWLPSKFAGIGGVGKRTLIRRAKKEIFCWAEDNKLDSVIFLETQFIYVRALPYKYMHVYHILMNILKKLNRFNFEIYKVGHQGRIIIDGDVVYN